MLAWTIYLSFAGALVQALLPKGNAALARWLALAVVGRRAGAGRAGLRGRRAESLTP